MLVDRILKIIELKGLNKSRFYMETGLSNGFLDKVKDIGASKIEQILNTYPDISPEWLISGKGAMLRKGQKESFEKNDNITVSALKVLPAGPAINKCAKTIPLVGPKAVGGLGNESFSIEQQDVKALYVVPKFEQKHVDFMIEVEGSSMYPKYNSGDVVACRKITMDAFIQWNKCHVIATRDQGIIIKRVKKSAKENHLLMLSDNKDYDPFEVPMDEIEGMALVIGVIRLE
jgi:repressor LexA